MGESLMEYIEKASKCGHGIKRYCDARRINWHMFEVIIADICDRLELDESTGGCDRTKEFEKIKDLVKTLEELRDRNNGWG